MPTYIQKRTKRSKYNCKRERASDGLIFTVLRFFIKKPRTINFSHTFFKPKSTWISIIFLILHSLILLHQSKTSWISLTSVSSISPFSKQQYFHLFPFITLSTLLQHSNNRNFGKAHGTKKGTFYIHSVAYPSTTPTVFYYSLIAFYSFPSILFTLSSSYNHNLYICLAAILNKVNRKQCRSYNTAFCHFFLFHFFKYYFCSLLSLNILKRTRV